jgi:hypothetical protein
VGQAARRLRCALAENRLAGVRGLLMRECLLAAIAAPSIHNSQPWRFRGTPAGIDVYADHSRILGVIDPDGRELFMSVGAAIFNLRATMLALGRQPVLRLLPDGPSGSDMARRPRRRRVAPWTTC